MLARETNTGGLCAIPGTGNEVFFVVTLCAMFSDSPQTAVFDQNKVFGQNPPMWLVDRFFLETVGISYETILQSLILGDNASAHSWIRDIERQIVKVASFLDIYHSLEHNNHSSSWLPTFDRIGITLREDAASWPSQSSNGINFTISVCS